MKAFISVVMTIISVIAFGNYPATYAPVSENADLEFVVISDIHMEGNNNERFRNFPKALMDINGAQSENDALVMLGDNTMNGQFIEHLFLTLSLKLFNDIDDNYIAMGNHEIFTEENGYEKGSAKFMRFAEIITGKQIDKPYYSGEVNGYPFIVLGSQADEGVRAYISPEQLEWLDNELDSAQQSGKPAFVFCHFPLDSTHNNAWPGGLIGEQSDEIYDILSSHKNVFYFSGHFHNAVDYSGIVRKDGVTFIDVPSLLSGNVTDGIDSLGAGYCVEVHDGVVELRARNFIAGEWIDSVSATIVLEK